MNNEWLTTEDGFEYKNILEKNSVDTGINIF